MLDRYRVHRVIKRGGMAEVLEASLRGVDGFERRVALKRLLPEFANDPEIRAAFIDEARIVGSLSYGNIVSILDFGLLEDRPIQVLELIDGEDLGSILDRSKTLPLQVALHIGVVLARALHYVHRARDAEGRGLGIVHRDVSPKNVLLAWSGEVKLADFGVAFAKDRLASTKIGETKGTLNYMAPEQAHGAPVDGRADLFALGCLLHRMLAGVSPLEDQEVRLAVLAGADCPIDPSLPDDVARIVRRATRASAGDRYADGAAFAADLWSALEKRGSGEGREVITEWLSSVRPKTARPQHALAALFDFQLLQESEPETGLHRFATVTKSERSLQNVPIADSSGVTIGAVIRGYRLSANIGTGGSSRVFLGRHQVLGTSVAIKILKRENVNPTAIQRLRREAQMLAQLDHPNVVRVIDCGNENGTEFLIMELLEGQSFGDVLEREAPMAPERLAPILEQILAGLAAAHARGLVHRDLKPGNIFLVDRDGRETVKIVDFGLVRAFDEGSGDDESPDEALTRLTRTGHFLGTLSYVSPEQIRSPFSVGPATDLYALGVIIHCALTGQAPFYGSPAQVIDQHLRLPPPPTPASRGLEILAQAMMQKDPADRPESAHEVLEQLRALDLLSPPPNDPTAVMATVITTQRRSPLVALVFVAAGLITGIAGVLMIFKLREEPEELAEAPAAKPAIEAVAAPVIETEPAPKEPPPPAIEPDPIAPAKRPPIKREKKPEKIEEKVPEPAPAALTTPEMLDRKIKELTQSLREADGEIPDTTFDAFDDRLLELRERQRSAKNDDDRAALLRALEKLAADLQRSR